MAAITRWISYDTDAVGSAGDGNGSQGLGTRGFSLGRGAVDADGINIGPTTNRLYVNIDGSDVSGSYITLYSGSALDPRLVARDITEKILAQAPSDEKFANAVCLWEDQYWGTDPSISAGNRLQIYSGTLGSASSVTVATSGTNTAHSVLGFGTKTETGGSASGNNNATDPYITVSGTYTGLFHEVYRIVISTDNGATRGIGTATPSIVYAGTATFGGVFNGSADDTYTVTIDVTNGTTMGAGAGNVPRMKWTSTNDSMLAGQWVELLYPNHIYHVGTLGATVSFTDAVFGAGSWSLLVFKPDFAQGSNTNAAIGIAQYVYASTRGDESASPTTTASGGSALGTKGLTLSFAGSNSLYAGDEFYVTAAGPYPGALANYNITSLNYGNVTVSTDSNVKAVVFEIQSGAVELSTVKFGLQNNGSFSHHNTGNSDTFFRFGTAGPGNNASDGTEWRQNVLYTDIDSDTPPSYLYATEDNLSVVSTADASESIGNMNGGLVADPMWLTIHLGASETGANSTINYRLYFDFS